MVIKRPPRAKWAELALQNLWRQKSFDYHHEINHSIPPVIRGYEDGHYVPGQSWIAAGEWHYSKNKEQFSIITIGKHKYEKEEGEWKIYRLNKEESIEARVKRLVSFGKFHLENDHFSFKPNLLYLDPLKKEKFTGRIEVDENRLLPTKIVVFKNDSIKVWEIEFFAFNRTRKISPPIRTKKKFLIDPATRAMVQSLKMRINTFGISNKVKYNLGQITVIIDEPITIQELRAMLEPGEGGIYLGHWRDNKFVKDSIVVSKKLINKVDLNFDPLSRPVIDINLQVEKLFAGHLGLFVDDELISTKYFDTSKKMSNIQFLMLSDFRKSKRAKGKLASPTLPHMNVQEVEY